MHEVPPLSYPFDALEPQQLLKLDPKFYDAYLTAGFSEYVLGSLPFFVRWFVHWENVNGSKEAGKQHLELAAFDRDAQIADPHRQQRLIVEVRPGGVHH